MSKHNNDQLIQALMVQIIWRARTVFFNVNQGRKEWGNENPYGGDSECAEWFWMGPMDLGGIRVAVDDGYAIFSFGGISVSTELCTKRNFYYGVHEPVLSEQEWVNWFNSVLAELDAVDSDNFKTLRAAR